MDLFLIRHGESYNNALEDVSQRVADPPLTAKGQDQARAAAEYIATGTHLEAAERDTKAGFDALFCSPMRRALQTTQPIAEALRVDPQIWIDVHEVGGIWLTDDDGLHGMTREQIGAEFPGARQPEGITDAGWWPGGQESYHAGRGRAIGVALELRRRARHTAADDQDRQRVAIVSHGDFMSALVKALLDHLPSQGVYYHHENTAITRFQLDGDGCTVRYVNRSEHLAAGGLRA